MPACLNALLGQSRSTADKEKTGLTELLIWALWRDAVRASRVYSRPVLRAPAQQKAQANHD